MVQGDPITAALKAPIIAQASLQVLAQAMLEVPHHRVAALHTADLPEAEVDPFQRKQQEQDNLNNSIL